jgi:hypothetical protein
LAVESALQTNPGARATVHFQDPPQGNADWESLKQKAEFLPIDLPALLAGLPPALAEAAKALEQVADSYPAGKSNVLRYLILHGQGGIYLDFDTLTLKSFAPLLDAPVFIGEEEVFRCDDDRVAGRITWDFPLMAALFGLSYGLSYANCRWLGTSAALDAANRVVMKAWSAAKLNNAVLGSEPGNPFFARALDLARKADAGMRFALGPMLMNQTFGAEGAAQGVHRLGKDFFYAVPPSQTFRFFFGPGPALPEAAVAVHWCSSNHRKLAPLLTRQALEVPGAHGLYGRLARKVLERGID